MDLKETALLGCPPETHWYYRAKLAALCQAIGKDIPRTIFDIGAGDGFFSRQLLAHTQTDSAICIDTGYTQQSVEMIAGKRLEKRCTPPDGTADMVLAMDVLEHVPDEADLLAPYIARADARTRFIITVPAFQFLWSAHDVYLGHYRRYTLRDIEHTLKRAGLSVLWGHYYYASVFPVAAAVRLAERLRHKPKQPQSQLQKHNPLLNAALATCCAWERSIMRYNRCFGLTAIVSARIRQ